MRAVAIHGTVRRLGTPQAMLGAALAAWWSADDLADGAVASWADRVGALAVTQATGDKQPVRAATSFAGKPGVTFDGLDDWLRVEATTGLPTGATAGRILVAGAPGTVAAAMNLIRYGGSAASTARAVSTTTANRLRLLDNTAALDDSRWSFAAPALAAGLWSGTEQRGRLNGRVIYPQTGSIASLNTGTTRTTIGANQSATPGGLFTGVIRHVFIGTWDFAGQEALEGWCAHEAGLAHVLPADHRYRFAVL